MKTLATALLCVLLASCVKTPPRAIIPPPAEISRLNVAPVVDAGKATRDAVRGVATAGASTRASAAIVSNTSRRLSIEIARAESLAQATAELTAALAGINALAKELEQDVFKLATSLSFAEEKERIALSVVDAQEEVIANLHASASVQDAEIKFANANEKFMRAEMTELAKLPDKLAAEKQKVATGQWWVKRLAITVGVLVLALAGAAYLILKP